MSEWTPKVGDRVMVGEHGPYEVRVVDECYKTVALLLHESDDPVLVTVGTAMWSWLSPVPEPEPDEPNAPGALVRDGHGALRTLYVDRDARRWYLTRGGIGTGLDWPDLARPVTVVLADPAEVDTLRAERDELQRRIDLAMELVSTPSVWDKLSNDGRKVFRILQRGER